MRESPAYYRHAVLHGWFSPFPKRSIQLSCMNRPVTYRRNFPVWAKVCRVYLLPLLALFGVSLHTLEPHQVPPNAAHGSCAMSANVTT